MGTTTPNLVLYKPAVGESGWGTLVDANFDVLDVAVSRVSLIRTVTVAGNAALTDRLILADATAAAFTLTLPTAVGNAGFLLYVKQINTNTNLVTVAAFGAQKIDKQSTYALTVMETITLVSDGANWWLI